MLSTTTRVQSTALAASATSNHSDTRTAAMEISHTLHDAAAVNADVLIFFASYHHAAAFSEAADMLRDVLQPEHLIGCTAESVLGDDQELDGTAGMTALAISMDGLRVTAFTGSVNAPIPLIKPDTIPTHVGLEEDSKAIFMLGDPFSTPITRLMPALNTLRVNGHAIPILGGIASGASQPGHNRLVLDEHITNTGLVGLTLSGDIEIDTIVSQGCRPIGTPLVITSSDANMLLELGGRPAMDVLQELASDLPKDDQKLLQRGLLIGSVLNEQKARFGRGDFLVRSILGVNRDRGGIVVGEIPRLGQTVQFHVRDAKAAHEDLHLLLDAQQLDQQSLAVLLMSCNGRGHQLFGQGGHDVSIIRERLQHPPLTGCFAAGEFGPIGGKSHLHGHTAVATVFRQCEPV